MTTRDQLRSAALKDVPLARFEFEYQGNKYEILEPTAGQMSKIGKKAEDELTQLVWMVIMLVVLPGTRDTVFEDADFGTLMGQSFKGFLSAATEAVGNLPEKK